MLIKWLNKKLYKVGLQKIFMWEDLYLINFTKCLDIYRGIYYRIGSKILYVNSYNKLNRNKGLFKLSIFRFIKVMK